MQHPASIPNTNTSRHSSTAVRPGEEHAAKGCASHQYSISRLHVSPQNSRHTQACKRQPNSDAPTQPQKRCADSTATEAHRTRHPLQLKNGVAVITRQRTLRALLGQTNTQRTNMTQILAPQQRAVWTTQTNPAWPCSWPSHSAGPMAQAPLLHGTAKSCASDAAIRLAQQRVTNKCLNIRCRSAQP